MCGCTLLIGSPHKNSELRRCSTRQPTVYSYTSSHRSPCIRVDSPTQFHLHQHHVLYYPDSQFNNIINIVATKHAISCNSCRDHMITINSYVSYDYGLLTTVTE